VRMAARQPVWIINGAHDRRTAVAAVIFGAARIVWA